MALSASRGSLGSARMPSARLASVNRRVVVVVGGNRALSPPRAITSANDAASSSDREQQAAPMTSTPTTGRRPLLTAALAAAFAATAATTVAPTPALAFEAPPPGYRLLLDRLDGYSFFYPEAWQQVTTSGNDVFFRNPRSAVENLFVDLSSPSSSRFQSVDDLGTPEEAAARLLDTFLNREFMSTRLGVKREGEVLSAVKREGPVDPETGERRQYLDIDVRLRSFASRSPYVVSSQEMLSDYGIEWDRRLMTTLGVANKRLYSLRLQTDYAEDGKAAAAPSAGAGAPVSTAADVFAKVRASFSVREVEV
jgi:hypothetical protein